MFNNIPNLLDDQAINNIIESGVITPNYCKQLLVRVGMPEQQVIDDNLYTNFPVFINALRQLRYISEEGASASGFIDLLQYENPNLLRVIDAILETDNICMGDNSMLGPNASKLSDKSIADITKQIVFARANLQYYCGLLDIQTR